MKLIARGRTLDFSARPLVMGILNLGADSFSGDGITNLARALARAQEMIAEGADIVDVGAESARTNRPPISEDEEIAMLSAFIERWPATEPTWLSLNTWRPKVARAVLKLGGDLLNDIGGLPTAENAQICAEAGAALLIMHSVGQPKVPHLHVGYDDVLAEVERYFAEKIALAESVGLAREALLLDPGLDFAKQRADNLQLLSDLSQITKFGRPILLPISRKTVIGDVLGIANPAERDAGTIACLVSGALRGANIFRVHQVRAAAQAVRVIAAVEKAV